MERWPNWLNPVFFWKYFHFKHIGTNFGLDIYWFIANFNFWTTLFCKNGPNFCHLCIPPFQKNVNFSLNLVTFRENRPDFIYRKVASLNTSRFEANVGLFRLSIKGIFNPSVLWPFGKNFIFELVTRVRTRDYTVPNFGTQ